MDPYTVFTAAHCVASSTGVVLVGGIKVAFPLLSQYNGQLTGPKSTHLRSIAAVLALGTTAVAPGNPDNWVLLRLAWPPLYSPAYAPLPLACAPIGSSGAINTALLGYPNVNDTCSNATQLYYGFFTPPSTTCTGAANIVPVALPAFDGLGGALVLNADSGVPVGFLTSTQRRNTSMQLMSNTMIARMKASQVCARFVTTGRESLTLVAALYGTSPWALRRDNPLLVSLPRDPAQWLVKGTVLYACPEMLGDPRFRIGGTYPKGCLGRPQRPCSLLWGTFKEACFCSYQDDGTMPWPYNANDCTTYITCSQGAPVPVPGVTGTALRKCPAGKVVDPQAMAVGNTDNFCVDPSSADGGTYVCQDPCQDENCYCRQYLLPPGNYTNPFDNHQQIFFTCGEHVDLTGVLECPQFSVFNPFIGECDFRDKFCPTIRTYGQCDQLTTPSFVVNTTCSQSSTAAVNGRRLSSLPLTWRQYRLRKELGFFGSEATRRYTPASACRNPSMTCCAGQFVRAANIMACTMTAAQLRFKQYLLPSSSVRARSPKFSACTCVYKFACPLYALGNCKNKPFP